MRTSSKIFLAGAALAVVGTAALAAALPRVHHLTVQLPDGGVEHIAYTGDATPQVEFLPRLVPVREEMREQMPVAMFASPFADLQQISAQMDQMAAAMDREMAVAMQQADAGMPLLAPDGLMHATLPSLPASSESYSVISTMSGGNVCTRMVQITSTGDGAKPTMVSRTSGNCAGANTPGASTGLHDLPSGARVFKAKANLPVMVLPRQHI